MKKNFKVKDVELPINSCSDSVHLAQVPKDTNFIAEDTSLEVLEDCAISVITNQFLLLQWPTWAGKTTVIQYLAEKTNNIFKGIQLNWATSIENLIWQWTIDSKGTKWQDWVLTTAMREGHWVLLDEINAALPEILFALHSVMDDRRILYLGCKPDGTNESAFVKAHPNFRLFGAMNPSDDYAGTKELNRALVDRFNIVVYVDYAKPRLERKIIKAKTGMLDWHTNISKKKGIWKEGFITRIVMAGNKLRNSYTSNIIHYCVSTRNLIDWANMCKYKDIKSAFNVTINSKIWEDSFKKEAQDIINLIFINDEKYINEEITEVIEDVLSDEAMNNEEDDTKEMSSF